MPTTEESTVMREWGRGKRKVKFGYRIFVSQAFESPAQSDPRVVLRVHNGRAEN